jgi:hypothetical protein
LSEAGFVSEVSQICEHRFVRESMRRELGGRFYIKPFRDRLLYSVDRGRYASACLRSG